MVYIIIGSGYAGIWAIEAIRESDRKNSIILISEEFSYSRPLISYYLGNKIPYSLFPYRDDSFFKKHNVTVRLSIKVVKVDAPRKQIYLSSGEILDYDKLLIATGGKPIIPSIEGIQTNGVFTFTTIEDVNRIKQFLGNNPVKQAIVLGGGLIGLKATEGFMNLKIQVTVVELADRILATTFDTKASLIIEKALEESNCTVIKNTSISKIFSLNGKINGIELKTGQIINCELLIIAVGVHPNLDLVKDSTLKTKRGLLVNNSLQTSDPDVYAAGDVAEISGSVVAILPLATHQGRIAGYNMTGGNKLNEGNLPMNSVELAGIPTISVGLTDPKDHTEEYEILEKFLPVQKIYRKIVLKGNIIVGFIQVNEIDRAGIITGLIKDKTDVSQFKNQLMEGNFGLITLPKELRKHLVQGPGIEI